MKKVLTYLEKVLTYLESPNFKEGFWRLALVTTPLYIIVLVIFQGFGFSETILLVNPISLYFFMKWIVIPPSKWVLKGFTNDDKKLMK